MKFYYSTWNSEGGKIKSIYLESSGKRHTLYSELIDSPPEGYEYIIDQPWDSRIRNISKVEMVYLFQKKILNKFIPVNLWKAYFEKLKKIPQNATLTYSSGHIIFRNEPWIVDLEYILHLSGYSYHHFKRYQKIIERYLKSDNCRRIIPWTDAGNETISILIKNQSITDKVETVNLAVHQKNFVKEYSRDKIILLFVGSINIPTDFYIKGGKEVLEAFFQLSKKYDNLELIVRSYIPQKIKKKYEFLSNIRFIENIIPKSNLDELFKIADIFLFPSHNSPGLVFLEAMSYELPIITTDVWANPEMVQDGYNGFVIKKSEKIAYYVKSFIPNWSSSESLYRIKSNIDPIVINQIIDKISLLIENENLRRRMGKQGRYEIEEGKFSIVNRNNKLKKIFDE